MTAQVLSFPVKEPSTFQQAWACVPMTMRRRSCKMATLEVLWDKCAREFGQQNLLASLRAYVTDADFARHGGQALERWLKAGRYEHFLPAAIVEASSPFPDAMVRRVVATRLGEDFCRAYLDPCTVEGTTLITLTDYAIGKMMAHRTLFRELGFTGMRKRAIK